MDDSLAHYGVPGMRWGKRKVNSSYSMGQQNRDEKKFGASGVRKINRRMNEGQSLDEARAQQKPARLSSKTKQNLALAGLGAGYITARLGPTVGRMVLTQLADANNVRKAAAGAAAANAVIRGIGANPTAALRLVDGVWKLAA